jgi:hypothetical protein
MEDLKKKVCEGGRLNSLRGMSTGDFGGSDVERLVPES